MSSIMRNQKVSIVIASSLILLGGGLTGCKQKQSVQALVAEANQYHQKGDDKAAIIQLKNALEKKPDDADTRALLGSIYLETGDAQSAEKEIRKAMSLGKSADQVAANLAKALLMQGQFQKALDATSQAAGVKADANILTLRGSAYLAMGKSAEAKEAFESALKEKPDYPAALIGLAKRAAIEKDMDSANAYTEQAVTKNPANIDALLFKGDLLRAQGKFDLALTTYDEIIKIKPDNVTARLDKANIEIGAGKFDAAKVELDAARKAVPKSLGVLYTQALLDFRQGKNAPAWDSLQQILRVAPEDMPTLLLAGAVRNAQGAMQEAEQFLRKYLDKNADNLYARKLLVSTLLKQGRVQPALDTLAPALKAPQPDAQLYALAGECYMQSKDYTKATEYFEKASALEPQAAAIHTSLGLSRLGQGESARAVTELEMAASLDPKSTKAGTLLVMTHLRLKEYDKALAAVKTLEQQQPNNPLYQNMKGSIYLGKADVKDARASFEKAVAMQPDYFPAIANLARLDIQDKKPDEAKKRFEKLLEKDKKNVSALTALASLALSQGKKQEATTLLEQASNENSDAIGPAMQLVTHYLSIGEKQKALTLARKFQAANPANAEVLEHVAQAQLAMDDKVAGLETYNKLAALLPDSPLVQYRIAVIQNALKNPSAANEALKKALLLKPDYLDALAAQIKLEVDKANYAQAIAIARQIQKQNSKSSIGYELEGDVLMAQKNPQAAVKAYEQGFAIAKINNVLIKLHGALTQSGKGKGADARVAQWLKAHPTDEPVRSYLATTYLASNQNKAAIEQYQTILRTDPNNVAVLNNLAWAYQQDKDPRAEETAEKAYQSAADSPAVLDTLGWILVEKGNTARGVPMLEKAVAMVPAASEMRYHLALGLIKAGDKAKARKELEQLVATGKTFAKFEEAKSLLKQL
jgi:putative PEP-CTERM system TPR-repeat lipoprotein